MGSLIDLFLNSPLVLFKIFLVLFEVMYLGFAFVLYKQERLMFQTIEIPVSVFLHTLVKLHLILSLVVLIVSLFLL